MNFIHERYNLEHALTPNSQFNEHHTDAQRVNFKLTPKDGSKNKAETCETRLVYVLAYKTKVLYVGEGYTDIRSRMRRGFIPRRHFERTGYARGGYKGYKWIDILINDQKAVLTLDVFMFNDTYNDAEKRQIITGIEGELVYLIRHETGEWPSYQNEIHFSNQEGTIETARAIYNIVKTNT